MNVMGSLDGTKLHCSLAFVGNLLFLEPNALYLPKPNTIYVSIYGIHIYIIYVYLNSTSSTDSFN